MTALHGVDAGTSLPDRAIVHARDRARDVGGCCVLPSTVGDLPGDRYSLKTNIYRTFTRHASTWATLVGRLWPGGRSSASNFARRSAAGAYRR